MTQKSTRETTESLARLPIRVSNPDKVFWPDEGYTKLDLIRYYDTVFPRLKPYVRDRPLSLERCPDGMVGECFFQKNAPDGLPAKTPTARIRHATGTTNYVVGGHRRTHLALANLGCIALHIWGRRVRTPRKPDWVCFNIDPPSDEFGEAVRVGLRLKEALDALGLVGYPKTSGKRGLHIFVPIRVGPDVDQVRAFATGLAQRMAEAYPEEVAIEARISERNGRVYIDSARNGFGQEVVAPYSVRHNPGAPISAPLDWLEVTSIFDPTGFNLYTVAERLEEEDPWADFFRHRQALEPAMRALRNLYLA